MALAVPAMATGEGEVPTNGQLGENIIWSYNKETDTLTLSGTGSTYDTNDASNEEVNAWHDAYLALSPSHVIVEEGIEVLGDSIFAYSPHLLDISLPTTLKEIPLALVGFNGPMAEMDAYYLETYGDVPGMTAITIPEGITSLTNSFVYSCWGISDYYLPSTLVEIDLDVLCYVAAMRKDNGMEPLPTTIHFAGTEEQWAAVKHVVGNTRENYGTGLNDTELEELFATFTIVFEAEEEDTEEYDLLATAYDMTYYVGGYGAIPGRYHCMVDHTYAEWFDIAYGDPIVENWPTKAGTYTVTFEKTTAIKGAGDTEYTFNVSMNITVLELPDTSGKCGDNMTWSFDTTTDTLTISGTGDMHTIAASDEDFQTGNFNYKPGWWDLPVKHIVIEEGIENLANYTFTQSGICNYFEILETIQLPTTLKAIPELGFLMSNAMTSLTIPEGITSITGWPFGYPGNSFLPLSDLYLPSTLREMDIVTIILGGYTNKRPITQTLKTIHFAGTEEQWNAINRIRSETMQSIMPVDDETYALYEETFNGITVVFESNEDVKDEVTVENGTATVPDSAVEVTEGEDVVIDVTDTEEEVSSVVIGSETVDKIADAETAVEIKLPDATVSFDATAVGAISEQAGETAVTIVATEVADTSLNSVQQAALEKKDVHTILNLEAYAGETRITEFGGGKVTVSVSFTLPEGKKGTDYYVAYIADDGTITAMPTIYADGILSFETTHFSNYVVLENAAVVPQPTPDPTNPQTGDSTSLLLLVSVMLLSAAGLSVCYSKRRAF